MRRGFERVQCPGCQRRISAYVPQGDDGRGLRLVPHNRSPSRSRTRPCPWSERVIVRKDGAWRLD